MRQTASETVMMGMTMISREQQENNRLAWAKRFQSFARLFWHEARGLIDHETGELLSTPKPGWDGFSGYADLQAKKYYARARVALGSDDEDEKLW